MSGMRYRRLGGDGAYGGGDSQRPLGAALKGHRDEANGLLSGKYRRGEPPPPGSRLQVAVGGLAALPQVGSVICGAMTPQQVTANAAAAGWTPDAADLAALDHIVPPGERVV
ncbi:hypothetical protein ACTWPT_44160 [Nonomuraea sp. 3N208]|uniref:hypothetical protein n=1 Tax=Nonomuraea sp. 3N208 TaxID=3457421 RepID=UPI003FD635B8